MADQRGCIYGYDQLGIPAVLMDGQSFTAEIPIPDYAPRPTPLTYMAWCHHMGQTPRESLGGLLYIHLKHADRTRTPLIVSGNWEGCASAIFDPPILVRETDKILLVFGGQTRPQYAWNSKDSDWTSREVFASVAPDISMRWLVTDGANG